MSRYVVAGPPCAGKSTFVRNHFKQGDLIYDYDSLHSALSGQGSHQHLPEIRPYVISARDVIFSLLEKNEDQNAWIITSTKSNKTLEEMKERFNAEVVLLSVDIDEAHRRCNEDNRPEAWHEYINLWFEISDIDPDGYPMPDIKSLGGKMRNKNKKTYLATIDFKAEEEGTFRAVFSTMNVIDHDGDVTLPGAFTEGQKVRIAYWGHRWQDLPVGRGEIHADEEQAWVDGKFFLDTQAGMETYKTVKNLAELQEWSYGFDIEKLSFGKFEDQSVCFLEKLEVFEISPVMLGAGIGTGTTAIKGAKKDGTQDDPEDGPEGEADLSTTGGDADGSNEDGKPSGMTPGDVLIYLEILAEED